MLDRIRFHALSPLAKHQNIFRHPGAGETRILAELLEQEALRLGSLHLNHRVFPDYVAAEVVESAAPVASLVADEILAMDCREATGLCDSEFLSDGELVLLEK